MLLYVLDAKIKSTADLFGFAYFNINVFNTKTLKYNEYFYKDVNIFTDWDSRGQWLNFNF